MNKNAYRYATEIFYDDMDFREAEYWAKETIKHAEKSTENNTYHDFVDCALLLLCIYANHWSNEVHSKEEITQLKEMLTDDNHEVIQHVFEDGLIIFGLKKVSDDDLFSIKWSRLPSKYRFTHTAPVTQSRLD